MNAGILAIQGDVARHAAALARVGVHPVAVRTAAELAAVDALVLPGGESTAMLRGIVRDGLEHPLRAFFASGRPVLGTCAGIILLARRVTSPAQPSFRVLDVDVERNAYGTQLDSFVAVTEPSPAFPAVPAVFIRAPRIVRVASGNVEVLARVGGEPVLVRAGAVWGATFHPELGDDETVLRRWLAGAPTTATRSAATS